MAITGSGGGAAAGDGRLGMICGTGANVGAGRVAGGGDDGALTDKVVAKDDTAGDDVDCSDNGDRMDEDEDEERKDGMKHASASG